MKICLKCQQRFESSEWNCPHCGNHPDLRGGFVCFARSLATANNGFSSDYFAQLSQVEASHFWFRSRNKLLQWTLRRYFPSAQTFLEVGCGTGFVLAGIRRRCPELHLVGTDIFTEGLRIAQSRVAETELLQMDARHMPFDAEFDVIGAFDALEHIEEDEQVLAEFFRSCRPGGGIILTVPQHRFLWSAADEHAYHKRRYVRRDLIAKIQAAGFKMVRATSFVSLLLPLMLISRIGRRHVDAKFDSLREFRISPTTNGALESVQALERCLIQAGISFPAGGSLLVVARRPSEAIEAAAAALTGCSIPRQM